MDNNADLKVSKSDFDQSINRFDFISGDSEFSLSYGKVVIYNEQGAKYRNSLTIQTASRIIFSGAILDMGD